MQSLKVPVSVHSNSSSGWTNSAMVLGMSYLLDCKMARSFSALFQHRRGLARRLRYSDNILWTLCKHPTPFSLLICWFKVSAIILKIQFLFDFPTLSICSIQSSVLSSFIKLPIYSIHSLVVRQANIDTED